MMKLKGGRKVEIGKQIKEHRKRMEWTQKGLAAKLNVSDKNNIELGNRQNLSGIVASGGIKRTV